MTLLDGALALGLLAVVPLASLVHPDLSRRAAVASLSSGAAGTVALLLPQGRAAVALVVPLLAYAGVAGALALARWWEQPTVLGLARPAAPAYLVVAAAWLGADRFDLEPVGFAPPFVQLTAIHFVYAGFASTVIALLVHERARRRLPRTTAAGFVATVAGPPLIAVGFTLVDLLLTVGAVVLTAGLYLVAAALLIEVAPASTGAARWLLRVAAVAVVVPMLLAVHWAAGATFGFASLSVPAMARTHGVVNALGFTLPGLLGLWLLTRARGDAARRARRPRGTGGPSDPRPWPGADAPPPHRRR